MSTVSEAFCYDCCFKHLSSAKVLLVEINNGYENVDHISNVVGNMALAEMHIYELYPEIAVAIRAERKKFWEGVLEGDIVQISFDNILQTVYDVATDISPEGIPVELQLGEVDGKKEEG